MKLPYPLRLTEAQWRMLLELETKTIRYNLEKFTVEQLRSAISRGIDGLSAAASLTCVSILEKLSKF